MAIKYVRNTDNAGIHCKIPSDKTKVFIFKQKKFDKKNNVLLSNGYTEISEEDLVLLEKESQTFNYYTKLNKLTVVDSLPQESMSAEQLISTLRAEIAVLRRAVKEASSAGSDDLEKKITEQAEEIDDLKQELANAADLPKVIEGLQDKLVLANQELEAKQDIIDDLKQELANAADLPKVIEELQDKLVLANQELEASQDIIAELSAQLIEDKTEAGEKQ